MTRHDAHITFIQSMISNFWDMLPKVRQMRRLVASVLGNDSVLEIGCGFGSNAKMIKGRYHGIDFDPSAIREAQRKHPDQTFTAVDGGRLDFREGEFDTVLFCLIFHETDEMESLIRKAIELKPGRIIVFDFNKEMPAWSKWRTSLLESSAFRTYMSTDLEGIFKSLGWTQAGSEKINALFHWWEFRQEGP